MQRFLEQREFAGQAEFTLIDFNQETIEHARATLEELKRKHRRETSVQVIKKSVNQILKESGRTVQGGATAHYDLVYCAGLFDYLSDQTCRLLSTVLFNWVAPGGCSYRRTSIRPILGV